MKVLLLIASLFALALPSSAAAHWALHPSSHQPAKTQLRQANLTIAHAGYAIRSSSSVVRWITRHPRLSIHHPDVYHQVIARARLNHALSVLRAHRWLLGYGDRERADALRRLTPPDPIALVKAAICRVFGHYCSQAVAVSGCETGGTYWPGSHNGQYLGIFQMGSHERATYGHGPTALEQARAAWRYFVASGKDWSPWECKP